MTSTQQSGISSDRIRDVSGIKVNHLECSICHDVLWKPIACQSCETPFCSGCINRWVSNNSNISAFRWGFNNPNQCPNRCKSYKERKCPPFIAKLLAELQITCFYKSTGCQQIVSYEALEKHEIECGYQPQQCPGCRLQILKKDFDDHKRNCASIELTCQDCKLIYKRGEATKKHTENICLKQQLQQVREESNKNRMEIQTLSLQLHNLLTLNPSLRITKITFDDLPNAIEEEKVMPNTYQGLKWTEFTYAHESYLKKAYPDGGYVTAFNNGCSPHIAFFGNDASITIERPNATFTFVSVTACAAWDDDLQLTITAHRKSIQINTHTTTLLFGQPQLIFLQWKNIDEITFQSFGGTAHPGTRSVTGSYVVITQLKIDLLN